MTDFISIMVEEGSPAHRAYEREQSRVLARVRGSKVVAQEEPPLASLTADEAKQIACAVQWAGHFGLQLDCKAGGPASSHIAAATAALERCGVPVYHRLATREKLAIPAWPGETAIMGNRP